MAPLVDKGNQPLTERDNNLVTNKLDNFDCNLVSGEQNNEMQSCRYKDVRDILTHVPPLSLFAV
jgi:hypothetical protein